MQAITYALRALGRSAAALLLTAVALSAMCAGPAAASTYSAANANPRPIPWTGWNGVPIQDPHKAVSRALLKRASFPRGWRAGAVGFGSGYRRLNGSKRVREVQRRLTRLGYHTGPIDGLLGPLTRSSIDWFQIKHGLRPTGVVAASTLAFLRHPKDLKGGLDKQAKKRQAPTGTPAPAPAPKPQPAPQPKATPPAHAKPAGNNWLVPLLIVLGIALVAAAIGYLWSRRRARQPAETSPGPEPEPPVVGYVSSESTEEADAQAAAIGEMCEEREWALDQVFHDWDIRAPSFRRPGLSHALDRLRAQTASRIVVNELEQLAGSLEELQFVLAWFLEEQRALTAIDVDLDTDTVEGVAAVAEILRLPVQDEDLPVRDDDLDDPDLLPRRIRAMRNQGMTFQAIADTLNSAEITAPNDEDWWRPSSVRLVLGTARFRASARSP